MRRDEEGGGGRGRGREGGASCGMEIDGLNAEISAIRV
jgi:hypothetical protein